MQKGEGMAVAMCVHPAQGGGGGGGEEMGDGYEAQFVPHYSWLPVPEPVAEGRISCGKMTGREEKHEREWVKGDFGAEKEKERSGDVAMVVSDVGKGHGADLGISCSTEYYCEDLMCCVMDMDASLVGADLCGILDEKTAMAGTNSAKQVHEEKSEHSKDEMKAVSCTPSFDSQHQSKTFGTRSSLSRETNSKARPRIRRGDLTSLGVKDNNVSSSLEEDVTKHGQDCARSPSDLFPIGYSDDDEQKEINRKKRNRESAKLSRERKRIRQQNLLARLSELEKANEHLHFALTVAQAKLSVLSRNSCEIDGNSLTTKNSVESSNSGKVDNIGGLASKKAGEGRNGQVNGKKSTIDANDRLIRASRTLSNDASKKESVLEGNHEPAALIVIQTLQWFLNKSFHCTLSDNNNRLNNKLSVSCITSLRAKVQQYLWIGQFAYDIGLKKCELPSILESNHCLLSKFIFPFVHTHAGLFLMNSSFCNPFCNDRMTELSKITKPF